MEETKKRVRRSKEQVISDKINRLQDEIRILEDKIADKKKQIEELQTPSVTLKDVTAKIKELGIAPDDVMKVIDKMTKK